MVRFAYSCPARHILYHLACLMLAHYLSLLNPLIIQAHSAPVSELFDHDLLLLRDTPDSHAFLLGDSLVALLRLLDPELEEPSPQSNFMLRVGTVSVVKIGLGSFAFCLRMMDAGSLKYEPQFCVLLLKKQLITLSNLALCILEHVTSQHEAQETFDRTLEGCWVKMLKDYQAEMVRSGVLVEIQRVQNEASVYPALVLFRWQWY